MSAKLCAHPVGILRWYQENQRWYLKCEIEMHTWFYNSAFSNTVLIYIISLICIQTKTLRNVLLDH